MMIQQYFLGANSKDGFVSLYGGFASAAGDTLHIVKGGPGTGKSGFMRRLGAAAEKRGLDVEYVLCSGDPDSLDGVYIPALRQGWADGTAPHALEPRHFGADGDYVDLGRFCRLPLEPADRAEIPRLTREYRALYARAYAYLSAAEALERAGRPVLTDPVLREAAARRVRSVLARHTAQPERPGALQRRFLSALSCRGLLRPGDELRAGYPLVYQLDDGLGLASGALLQAAQEAEARGLARILCPSPLDPEQPEALLLPEDGLALLRGDWGLEDARHLRLDALLPPEQLRLLRPELRRSRRASEAALAEGLEKLREAKALHDRLEAIYRPYMDFAALDEFTEETIVRVFGA